MLRFGSTLLGKGLLLFDTNSPLLALDDATSASLTRAASTIGRAEGFTGHAEAAEVREELRQDP